MDFFKSVFSDSPPESPPPSSSPSQTLISDTSPKSPSSSSATVFGGSGGGWSFGELIQTLSSKSESVIETYRRDLQEFSTGLKNETQVLKNVAATATSQVSLESVGKAVDSLGVAVSEIIFHAGDNQTTVEPENQSSISRDVGVKYSRFESQLRMIQMDERTYVEDNVEDGERDEFDKWKLGFDLGEHATEVDELLRRKEDGVAAIYDRVVPSLVDHETFWLRYFYRVWRLKKAEFVRAKLVKRAVDGDDDDEELTWDVDDDNNNNDDVVKKDVNPNEVTNVGENVEKDESKEEEGGGGGVGEILEGKGEASETSKDTDISVVSSQPSCREEEDIGWDEIEDVGSGDDENKGGLSRVELRKRVSVTEDDEDLSWDIEDDDEPIKS